MRSRRRAPDCPLGTLHQGDALAWLRGLGPETVDLVFADPPYNAGREDWDSFASQAAYLAWCDAWVAEAARILRPTGSVYICGFSEILADVKALIAPRFASCRWLVWPYRNKANVGGDWGRSHESILHLRRDDFRLNLDEARIPYNAHTVRYPTHPQAQSSRYGRSRYVWQPHPLGAKPRDVLDVPTLANGMREKTSHPTQKPIELVRRLILAATRAGDLVVDPFAGSGTTLVACEGAGRGWLGCELDADYCALIAERLATGVASNSDDEAARRRQRQRLR